MKGENYYSRNMIWHRDYSWSILNVSAEKQNIIAEREKMNKPNFHLHHIFQYPFKNPYLFITLTQTYVWTKWYRNSYRFLLDYSINFVIFTYICNVVLDWQHDSSVLVFICNQINLNLNPWNSVIFLQELLRIDVIHCFTPNSSTQFLFVA